MKRILLLLITLFLFLSGFSQNFYGNSSNWNDPVIEEKGTSMELKIYPNPCKNEKLTLDFISHKIAEITLTNIIGKEVFLKKIKFPENKIQIQLTNIPNGIYFLKVITEENKVAVKKLMVSKN